MQIVINHLGLFIQWKLFAVIILYILYSIILTNHYFIYSNNYILKVTIFYKLVSRTLFATITFIVEKNYIQNLKNIWCLSCLQNRAS